MDFPDIALHSAKVKNLCLAFACGAAASLPRCALRARHGARQGLAKNLPLLVIVGALRAKIKINQCPIKNIFHNV